MTKEEIFRAIIAEKPYDAVSYDGNTKTFWVDGVIITSELHKKIINSGFNVAYNIEP